MWVEGVKHEIELLDGYPVIDLKAVESNLLRDMFFYLVCIYNWVIRFQNGINHE